MGWDGTESDSIPVLSWNIDRTEIVIVRRNGTVFKEYVMQCRHKLYFDLVRTNIVSIILFVPLVYEAIQATGLVSIGLAGLANP